jgi:hypothetical protein
MKGETPMPEKSTQADLLIRAVLKLDPRSGERQNVLLFLQSCYACRVCTYDFEAAQRSLEKLTGEEQHALMAYVHRAA